MHAKKFSKTIWGYTQSVSQSVHRSKSIHIFCGTLGPSLVSEDLMLHLPLADATLNIPVSIMDSTTSTASSFYPIVGMVLKANLVGLNIITKLHASMNQYGPI